MEVNSGKNFKLLELYLGEKKLKLNIISIDSFSILNLLYNLQAADEKFSLLKDS